MSKTSKTQHHNDMISVVVDEIIVEEIFEDEKFEDEYIFRKSSTSGGQRQTHRQQ